MKKCILFLLMGFQLINAQEMKQLTNDLDVYFKSGTTPGFQYVVMNSEGIVYEYNQGLENIALNKKVDPQSIFKIFSTTKVFTAISVMQLVEQGKINLDDPVSEYIKDVKLKNSATVKQLLTHTAGLANPFPKWIHFEDEHDGFDYKSFSNEIREKYSKNGKAGKKHRYSNISSLYLAKIIENVSGEDYMDYVNNHIIKTARMEEELNFEIPQDNYAVGYSKNSWIGRLMYKMFFDVEKLYGYKDNEWIGLNKFYLNGAAYGGLHGNAYSLASFGAKFFLSENKMLKPETLTAMTTPIVETKSMYKEQCLGWFKGEMNGQAYIAHAGGGGGFSVELRYYPQKGIVTAFAMNRSQTFKDLKLLNKFDKYF